MNTDTYLAIIFGKGLRFVRRGGSALLPPPYKQIPKLGTESIKSVGSAVPIRLDESRIGPESAID